MTAQPPHNNRPDNKKPGETKAKPGATTTTISDNQADWLNEMLNKLIDSGVIWLTKDNIINPEAVEKFAYARERLREEQRDRLPEIIAAITTKIAEERQSAKIELIDMLITTKTHLSSVKMMELSAELEAGLKRED